MEGVYSFMGFRHSEQAFVYNISSLKGGLFYCGVEGLWREVFIRLWVYSFMISPH